MRWMNSGSSRTERTTVATTPAIVGRGRHAAADGVGIRGDEERPTDLLEHERDPAVAAASRLEEAQVERDPEVLARVVPQLLACGGQVLGERLGHLSIRPEKCRQGCGGADQCRDEVGFLPLWITVSSELVVRPREGARLWAWPELRRPHALHLQHLARPRIQRDDAAVALPIDRALEPHEHDTRGRRVGQVPEIEVGLERRARLGGDRRAAPGPTTRVRLHPGAEARVREGEVDELGQPSRARALARDLDGGGRADGLDHAPDPSPARRRRRRTVQVRPRDRHRAGSGPHRVEPRIFREAADGIPGEALDHTRPRAEATRSRRRIGALDEVEGHTTRGAGAVPAQEVLASIDVRMREQVVPQHLSLERTGIAREGLARRDLRVQAHRDRGARTAAVARHREGRRIAQVGRAHHRLDPLARCHAARREPELDTDAVPGGGGVGSALRLECRGQRDVGRAWQDRSRGRLEGGAGRGGGQRRR